jgi:ribonuclease HI
MEMLAVVRGLEATDAKVLNICLDSSYIRDSFRKGWLKRWKRNGWRSTTGPVKNQDLWESLLELTKDREIYWRLVKGHSGVELNEECDRMATQMIDMALLDG